MQQFASRDLMVAVLAEDAADEWEMQASCSPCTNDTNGGCTTKTGKCGTTKSDLAALQEQLRAARV